MRKNQWNAAQGGNIEALYNLGIQYYWGKGVEKNELQAKKLIEEAAQAGHVRARILISKFK